MIMTHDLFHREYFCRHTRKQNVFTTLVPKKLWHFSWAHVLISCYTILCFTKWWNLPHPLLWVSLSRMPLWYSIVISTIILPVTNVHVYLWNVPIRFLIIPQLPRSFFAHSQMFWTCSWHVIKNKSSLYCFKCICIKKVLANYHMLLFLYFIKPHKFYRIKVVSVYTVYIYVLSQLTTRWVSCYQYYSSNMAKCFLLFHSF